MDLNLSDKHSVRNLIEICAAKGIEYVILSPGSRNAPLTITFNEYGTFNCLSIPDERCAAFVALGIAQQTGKPAIICCTSGSASLNYAPAVSEAFYQKIPMIVITADRPEEWINQGEGQSIPQKNIYRDFILGSYHLHLDLKDSDFVKSNDRMINEAINQSLEQSGPVHINMPFREPLYQRGEYGSVPLPKIITSTILEKSIPEKEWDVLAEKINKTDKIIILCGLSPARNEALKNALDNISDKAVILAESTSNITGDKIITLTDSLFHQFDKEKSRPDLLLTIGHSFISKKIKLWLREKPPREHWHIGEGKPVQDVFQSLTRTINISPEYFFENLIARLKINSKREYIDLWHEMNFRRKKILNDFLKNCPWSDLVAFSKILPSLPLNANLQMGNSSPVRYIQLFPLRGDVLYNGNRGVSGIDGSTSTAVGASLVNQRPTILITGDIAFFYDSNAFWNHHLSGNLRVILINNEGGSIFSLIPGPPSTKQFEQFFETRHDFRAEGICNTFGIHYYFASDSESLEKILPDFYAPQKGNRPAVLEIKTPREHNDVVFDRYRHLLKTK